VREFTKNLIEVIGEEYLRSPNVVDITTLKGMRDARGFPGCLDVLIECTRAEELSCRNAMGNAMLP
jgi:hypothetical protein